MSAPVVDLFPLDRVVTHLLVADYGTARQEEHVVVTVIGADGIARVVARSRALTGAQAAAAEKAGAQLVVSR